MLVVLQLSVLWRPESHIQDAKKSEFIAKYVSSLGQSVVLLVHVIQNRIPNSINKREISVHFTYFSAMTYLKKPDATATPCRIPLSWRSQMKRTKLACV